MWLVVGILRARVGLDVDIFDFYNDLSWRYFGFFGLATVLATFLKIWVNFFSILLIALEDSSALRGTLPSPLPLTQLSPACQFQAVCLNDKVGFLASWQNDTLT